MVFGDSFKITNIAIVENKGGGQLFVSMPRYKINERSEDGFAIWQRMQPNHSRIVRNFTASNILEEYERVAAQGQPEKKETKSDVTPPSFPRNGYTLARVVAVSSVYFKFQNLPPLRTVLSSIM